MARDMSRRAKLSRKHAQSCNASPYKIQGLELFSHMSMEAVQAINETRREMNQEPKRCTEKRHDVKENGEEEAALCNEDKQGSRQHQNTEDHDSAIGTSSMRSTPVTAADEESAGQVDSSKSCRKSGDRQRPVTVCALRTEMQSHGHQRPICTSFSTSHLIDECLKKHSPLAKSPANVKKLNVFERLSAPAPISYKPTARQRTRARLSLSLSINNDRKHLIAFGQRIEPNIRWDCLMSAFPTVLRSQNQQYPAANQKEEGGKGITSSVSLGLAKRKPEEDVNKPRTKLISGDDKQVVMMNKTASEKSVKSAERHPMHTSRQFEITPLGYDSRYATIKYDQALFSATDFDEEVMLEESKLKCQQWLAHQTRLLTNR